jgi:hypothetical protein
LIYFFNKDVGENIKLKEAFMGKEKWGAWEFVINKNTWVPPLDGYKKSQDLSSSIPFSQDSVK